MTDASDLVTVHVPKEAGTEITLRRGGREPETYPVERGTVKVAAEDVQHFLVVVDGSTVKGGNPAQTQE